MVWLGIGYWNVRAVFNRIEYHARVLQNVTHHVNATDPALSSFPTWYLALFSKKKSYRRHEYCKLERGGDGFRTLFLSLSASFSGFYLGFCLGFYLVFISGFISPSYGVRTRDFSRVKGTLYPTD